MQCWLCTRCTRAVRCVAPTAVALDAVGNVYVCDSGGGRVVRFDVHAMEELRRRTQASACTLHLGRGWYDVLLLMAACG